MFINYLIPRLTNMPAGYIVYTLHLVIHLSFHPITGPSFDCNNIAYYVHNYVLCIGLWWLAVVDSRWLHLKLS